MKNVDHQPQASEKLIRKLNDKISLLQLYADIDKKLTGEKVSIDPWFNALMEVSKNLDAYLFLDNFNIDGYKFYQLIGAGYDCLQITFSG